MQPQTFFDRLDSTLMQPETSSETSSKGIEKRIEESTSASLVALDLAVRRVSSDDSNKRTSNET